VTLVTVSPFLSWPSPVLNAVPAKTVVSP